MAVICDVCEAELTSGGGLTEMTIRPPKYDTTQLATAFAVGAMNGQIPNLPSSEPRNVDLCLACTFKALKHLGIGDEEAAANEETSAPADAPKIVGGQGPLTAEDLRALGIDPASPPG